jgi:hypothetical protein
MRLLKHVLSPALSIWLSGTALVPASFAASHREAPITALDQKADITDWYAFVSPEHPDRVVMILDVDPFLEPSNGPNYFPFDPNILYEMKVDNDRDGVEDIVYQFRFKTEIRQPGVFTGFVGNLLGIPAITALDGPGSEGLSLRQSYTVTMVQNKNGKAASTMDLSDGRLLFAVPSNVGPRTMPNYDQLRAQGAYDLGDGVRVFAGTVADPFFIDLGAAFDSLNFRMAAGGGVLSAAVDGDDQHNYAPNTLAGYNVNSIVLEVPIAMLTRTGMKVDASDKDAVIGTYGTTSRRRTHVLRDAIGEESFRGGWVQVQRMGNPLINELLIGTGSKDRFSMDEPENDKQFASMFLDPLLARIFKSIGVPVPDAPRTDLLPLVVYAPPICPQCTAQDNGPVADLLRLNTGIPPTSFSTVKRLGFIAGDTAGFPNGRRLQDDVTDIAARAVAGILADSTKYGTRIGDGVNAPASPVLSQFPFVAPAYSGRDSAHSAGPGLAGCVNQSVCPVE